MSPFYTRSFLLLFFSCSVFSNNIFAQLIYRNSVLVGQQSTHTTLTPVLHFLRINPDAKAGALGETGIATTPDVNSLYFNVAKLAFVEKKIGIVLMHSPWLTHLVDDYSLNRFGASYRLNEKESIGVSFRYFSLGETYYNNIGFPVYYQPIELAVDIGYARKLSEKTSLGMTLKYGHSDFHRQKNTKRPDNFPIKIGRTIAIDMGVYHQNPNINFLGHNATFSWGIALTNLGSKVSYSNEVSTAFFGRDGIQDFIPTNLGVGTAFDMKLHSHHHLMLAFDVNKLMIPTPHRYDQTESHRSKLWLKGMITSFWDARRGYKEELEELMFSLGIEYRYKRFLALRLGRFHEHELKGNRQYFTSGIGLKHKFVEMDVSYIFPSSDASPYLDKTFRFQLGFEIE